MQQHVEPVQEEQNQEQMEDNQAQQQQPNQIPDGGLGDDESAATEVAEAPGAGESEPLVLTDDHLTRVVDQYWSNYD